MKTRPRQRIRTSKFEKIFIHTNLAKLARTHKIIRIEQKKVILFIKLCSQIRLDDFKQQRSDRQREERKLKRLNKYFDIIPE